MDLKEPYRQYYDFDIDHSELLRFSQNLASFSRFLYI